MSRQILDCLKRERDICVKNVIHSQNTAFMFTPALRGVIHQNFTDNTITTTVLSTYKVMCPNSSWSPRSNSSKALSESLALAEPALCVCRFWARRAAALHSAGLWAFIKDSTVCTLAPNECDFVVDWKAKRGNTTLIVPLNNQARVVQKVNNAIHRINHYPADSVVCFVNIYPLDSDLSGG